MKTVLLLILVYFFLPLHCQLQVSGKLIDAITNEPLAFVNIGIKNKNVGTVSLETGAFSILIPEKNKYDSLTFSLVGYHLQTLPIQQFIGSQPVVKLKARAVALRQVTITAKKLTETRHGIKKTKSVIHFIDASTNQKDIFEIAQLIKLGNTPSKITSVNLFINESRSDSGTFRINFYKYDGTEPGERLIDLNILQTQAIREGWLSFDLKKYAIYLKGAVVAAIEFLPREKAPGPIKYEVKLGGSSRSFVRTSSMGIWNTPPHHYKIFLTALETASTNEAEESEEEKETLPDKRFFSSYVKDTFSLFIHLPKGYQKHPTKKYPAVFLLDANIYYDIVSSSVKKRWKTNKQQEPIVIGIGYANAVEADSLRNRDYTFPLAQQKDSFPVSGGAERFIDFIEKELNHYLLKNYRIDTVNRTLMGHSLGGYFTLFVLQKQLKSSGVFFKNFISASPSLEYGNSYLLSALKELTVVHQDKVNLLITTGERETEDAPLFKEFTELLSQPDLKIQNVTKIVFPAADHMDTAIPSFDKGLEMIQ